jgi:hypothetical protein
MCTIDCKNNVIPGGRAMQNFNLQALYKSAEVREMCTMRSNVSHAVGLIFVMNLLGVEPPWKLGFCLLPSAFSLTGL